MAFNSGNNFSFVTNNNGNTGVFGQNQQVPNFSVFGNTGTPFGNGGNGVFGGQKGNSFMDQQNQNQNLGVGFQNNTNPTASPFGGFGQNNQGFGNANTAQNKPNGGFFNNFGTQNTQSAFGNNTATQQNTFGFGNTQNQLNSFTSPQNNFIKPNNGVINMNTQNAFSNTFNSHKSFVPVKSKNVKLDGKHQIKCVSLLDENAGCCLKEVRAFYYLTGGAPPPQTINNNLAANGNSNVFGGNSFANSQSPGKFNFPSAAFGQPNQYGQNQQTNNSFLGGNNFAKPQTPVGNSPFIPPPQQQQTSPFGSNPQQSAPVFGSFANPTPTQGIFGNSANQTFNAIQPQNNQLGFNTNPLSPFGQQQQPQTMFQPQNQTQNTMFPNNTNQNTFPNANSFPNNQNTQNQMMMANASYNLGNSMFGTNPSVQGQGQTPNINTMDPSYQFANSMMHQININDLQYQTMILNSFLSSDLFKTLVNRQNKQQSYDSLTERIGNERTSRYFDRKRNFEEYDDFSSGSSYRREQKSYDFYRSPYIFTEAEVDYPQRNYNRIKQKLDFKPANNNNNRNKNKNQSILRQTPLDSFQQSYDKFHKKTLKQITVKSQDLPHNFNGFTVTPNIQKLAQMTKTELNNVYNVVIQNKFGRLKFKEPVSLYRKNISESISIDHDSIHIPDPDWSGKRCELIVKNFSNYTNANETEQKKIQRKLRRWAEQNNMKIIQFTKKTGDCRVEFCI